jgi:hypothetical protein
MKQKPIPDWARADYKSALKMIEETDEGNHILNSPQGVTAILPGGLPGNGFHFIGIIMMAPLLIFMALCIFFPIIVLQSEWNSATTPFVAISGSLVLLWALLKVLQMMIKNRDLFPLRYFVTLSDQGIAMHFAGWHFPAKPGKIAIQWKDVDSIETTSRVYLLALLQGALNVRTLEIVSSNGDRVLIPFRPKSAEHFAEKIQALIRGKAPAIEI